MVSAVEDEVSCRLVLLVLHSPRAQFQQAYPVAPANYSSDTSFESLNSKELRK